MGKLITLNPHTRASLDVAKTAGTLDAGELYHITDEARVAVGTGASTYIALVKESEGGLSGVAPPTNLLPTPSALGVARVRLVGSIYYSTAGEAHQASKFQVSTDSAFGTLAYEATKGPVTSLVLTAADIAVSTHYYWRVSYQDMTGAWSAWSTPTEFTTGATISGPVVTGGVVTTSGLYTIHTFKSSATLNVELEPDACDVLVVAGGGGGGSDTGGGGGGGGVLYYPALAVGPGAYPVTVGGGGSGGSSIGAGRRGGNGLSSAVAGVSGVAVGGGGGGGNNPIQSANAGGSGGGQSYGVGVGGAGTTGQGFPGGSRGGNGFSCGGGGGGGEGSPGDPYTGQLTAGTGGIGFACSISPAATRYAGGGGGGSYGGGYGEDTTAGGAGGGGAGGSTTPTAGGANTGGGGGGGGQAVDGAAGGSGVVIVRYLTQG